MPTVSVEAARYFDLRLEKADFAIVKPQAEIFKAGMRPVVAEAHSVAEERVNIPGLREGSVVVVYSIDTGKHFEVGAEQAPLLPLDRFVILKRMGEAEAQVVRAAAPKKSRQPQSGRKRKWWSSGVARQGWWAGISLSVRSSHFWRLGPPVAAPRAAAARASPSGAVQAIGSRISS